MRGIVLRFMGHKVKGRKFVSDIRFLSWPRDLTSLKCRLPDDPAAIHTFDELNEKFKESPVTGMFCIYFVNSKTKQEKQWCVDLLKYCPEDEGVTKPQWKLYDIEELLKDLGY